MKIFIYDHLDEHGKPVHQELEISDEEAEQWVQIDFERRQQSDSTAKPRSCTEIMREMNREYFNADRKEWRHQASVPEVKDLDGDDIDYFSLIPDDSPTPLESLISNEEKRNQKEKLDYLLSQVTPIQASRIYKYYGEEKTLREIATEEGVDYKTVDESIKQGMKKNKKILENTPTK